MFKATNNLRHTHRNLFYAVLLFGIWGIANGLSILLTRSIVVIGVTKTIFGAGYLLFGGMKLFGATIGNIKVARAGMLGCMCFSILFSGFALSRWLGGDIRSPLIALHTLAIGLVQLTAMAEPSIQPYTMKQGK